MAHKHSVYDTDPHFAIDPITRAITNLSTTKTQLMQYDHNSERFTFEIPRLVDGHDMTQCDKIEIHYINVDAATKESKADVYTVDDKQLSPASEDVVIFSWLISKNATGYAGTLNFLVRFVCLTGTIIDYVWSSDIHKGISVGSGMNNTGAITEDDSDVLEAWKASIDEKVPQMSIMDKMMFDKFGKGEKDYFFSQKNWDDFQKYNRAYVQAYDEDDDLRLGDDGKGMYALKAICRFGEGTVPIYPWMKKSKWVEKYREANPPVVEAYTLMNGERGVIHGVPSQVIVVDVLPEVGEPVMNNMENPTLATYYLQLSDGGIYGYLSAEMTNDEPMWESTSGESDIGGVISDESEAIDDNAFYIVYTTTELTDEEIINNYPPADTDYDKMSSLVERRPDGYIRTPKTFDYVDGDASQLVTSKDYVDTQVATRQDKLGYPGDGQSYAYTLNGYGKPEPVQIAANSALAGTMVKRNDSGNVVTGTPLSSDEAIPKWLYDEQVGKLTREVAAIFEKIRYNYSTPATAGIFDDLAEDAAFPLTVGGVTITPTIQTTATGTASLVTENSSKYIQLDKTATTGGQAWFDITKESTGELLLTFQARLRFRDAIQTEVRLYKDSSNRAYSQKFNWKYGYMYFNNANTYIFLDEWFTFRVEYSGTVGSDFKTVTYINGKEVLTTTAPATGTASTVANTLTARLIGAADGVGAFEIDDVLFEATGQPEAPATEGLEYRLNTTYYDCVGIGTATDTDIKIASEIDGLPVTEISNVAFTGNENITSVTIPDSITCIYSEAFEGCSNLAYAYFPVGSEWKHRYLDDFVTYRYNSLDFTDPAVAAQRLKEGGKGLGGAFVKL